MPTMSGLSLEFLGGFRLSKGSKGEIAISGKKAQALRASRELGMANHLGRVRVDQDFAALVDQVRGVQLGPAKNAQQGFGYRSVTRSCSQ